MGNALSSTQPDEAQLDKPKISNGNDGLQLVLRTLATVKELIRRVEKEIDRRDKRYSFLGNILTAAVLLEDHLHAIEDAGKLQLFETQIGNLADLLDELFDDTVINLAQGKLPSGTPHLRLRAVQEILSQPADRETHLQKIEACFSIIPSSYIACVQVEKRLLELSDSLQEAGEDLPNLAQKRHQQMPSVSAAEVLGRFAERTFEALSCSHCRDNTSREIRLKVGTYRTKKAIQGANTLCILLARDSNINTWHEVLVHDSQHLKLAVHKKTLKFALPDPEPRYSASWCMTDPKYYPCICCALKSHPDSRSDGWKLNIVLDPAVAGIYSHLPEERTYMPPLLQHQVNLKDLLALKDKDWTELAKAALAVIMAYSLFYLCGGPWSRERWRRSNIFFFKDGARIPLRPFISSSPGKGSEPILSTDGLHKYPEFLELGVVLLEIHLGEDLGSYLGDAEKICTYDDLWLAASKAFKKRQLYFISEAYRDAIAKCLKPDFSVSGPRDDEKLRAALFKDIISPLETELGWVFREFISLESLDDYAEDTVDLGTKQRAMKHHADQHNVAATLPKACLDDRPGYICQPPVGLQSSQFCDTEILQHSHRIRRKSTSLQTLELFTDDNQIWGALNPAAYYKKTDQYKSRFLRLVESHLDEDDVPEQQRLKIAILDSGFDSEHSYFYEDLRIKDAQSWVQGPPNEDTSGHGTHIAGIILDLTRNADIYIGRITETKNLSDLTRIPEAIKHAREVWKVDIISMSFGLMKKKRIKAIHREIDKCVKAGILIFAAANNDGGNSGRAYPAKHGDGVFCVHSATGEGARATYNPTPEPHEDNFSFVGDGLFSCWPSSPESNHMRYMSGTSFATPVAAAVAAFLIGYIRKNMPEHEEWCDPPTSFQGIRKLFLMMSEKRDNYDWVNLLEFFSNNEDRIMSEIESKLE